MSGQTVLGRLILVTSAVILISTPALTYNIDPLTEPYSPGHVGNLTDSVRVVNLTDNGEPVTESDVEDGFSFNYTYNASDGDMERMSYLSHGYWYAEIQPDTSRGKTVDYMLKEKTGTEDEFTASEKLEFGNYSAELISDMDEVLPPGETVNVRVNITDEWNSEPENSADVNLYFTNTSTTLGIQGLDNQDGSEYYNSEINIPDVHAANYIIHINVSNTGESIENPETSYSIPVETEPPMQGHIQELESVSGCNNRSFFTECEREAEISTSYNVTGEIPQDVNLTLNVWNISNSTWQNRTVIPMEEDEGLYTADLTLPDLNTTVFGDTVQMLYNATGEETNALRTRNITIRSYDISFGAASSARQGGDYNLEISFEKYFSSQPLERNDTEANVTISNSTDELREFTLEDMEFENSVFNRDVSIGPNWAEGTYNIEVEAENMYNEQKSATDSFFVEEVNRTFNMTGDIEDSIVTAKNYSYNFTVENLRSTETTLEPEVTGEIEGYTWVNNGSDVTVPGNSDINVTAKFNMTEVVERDGEITLSDNAYNESIDVDLDIPGCDYRDGVYCIEIQGDQLNESIEQSGYDSSYFTLYYLAAENSSETVQPSVEGNLTEYVSFDPESVEMNSSNSEEIFEVNYSGSSPGYFTGSMAVGNLTVWISLDSEVEQQEISFQTPFSIDLGTLGESEEVSETVSLDNTGNMDIESVSFESDQMSVSADSAEIPAGESTEFELEISEVSSGGTIQVTAASGEQSAEQSIDVSVDLVEDYAEQAGALRERINQLQTRVESGENQNTLNTASLNVTEVENAYQAGNYERAERIYQATESRISRVESGLNSRETEATSTEQSADPGQTGGSSESSMLPIIAGVIFILLIIGFIAYTSLIPEEGDPLYKVLGR